METRMRQVRLYRGEDGFWVAELPSLAGCVTQGVSRDAAIANIREAIEASAAALEVDGLVVPEERCKSLPAAE